MGTESTSVLDEIYGAGPIDEQAWIDESAKKKEQAEQGVSEFKYVKQYKLGDKAPENKGLVSFLNDGLAVMFHTYRIDTGKGYMATEMIACKRSNCELCAAGDAPKQQVVYALVDWMNSFTTKANVTVRQPSFKVLIKGVNTVKVIKERRAKYGIVGRGKPEHQMRSMTGRKWEMTRMGSGFQTYYDPMPEDEFLPDFTERRVYTDKEGKQKETSAIAMPPSWPKYLDAPETSIYTAKQAMPQNSVAPDWNNPAAVDLWLKCYFMNHVQSDYVKYGKVPSASAGKSTQALPSGAQSVDPDSDIPF